MGFFKKKIIREDEKTASTIEPRLGFVLFDSLTFNWDSFKNHLQVDWNITVREKPDKDVVVFDYANMHVVCGFMKSPVPNNEVQDNAILNVLWKDAVAEVDRHNSHMVLSVTNGNSAIDQSIVFTKVAASMLKDAHAIGIYQNPSVYSAIEYISSADMLRSNEFPIFLWMYFRVYAGKDGTSGYTMGLRYFGFDEIEVLDSKEAPGNVFGFLINISAYVIEFNVVLHNGETIGFSEDQKLPIVRSKGVSIEGDSIKIGF
jgi:hypothetical protein